MSALTDALAGMAGPDSAAPARRCKISRTLDTLDTEDRDALHAAIGDHDRSAANLAGILRTSGIDISASSINAHRRRDCICTPTSDEAQQ